jgi:hypothetical protein
VTRPIKPILIKPPGGGWYIMSPDKKPRTLMELLPALARNMIREHDGRNALKLFGPYHWAEELVRRYKVDCKTSRRGYSRDKAINEAADAVRLDPSTLKHWLNRSKTKRRDR